MANQRPTDDDIALSFAGRWQLARGQALTIWARSDIEDRFGTIEDMTGVPDGINDVLEHLRLEMKHLEQTNPTTMAGATVLLKVVIQMLCDRRVDPEWTIATGDVLAIVQNVKRALDFVDEQLLVGAYKRVAA